MIFLLLACSGAFTMTSDLKTPREGAAGSDPPADSDNPERLGDAPEGGEGGTADSAEPEADSAEPEPDPCAPTEGSLEAGQEHEVDIDDWEGDGETTEPKADAGDGDDGDNAEFVRINVARAHCGGDGCYWYSSSHQESGEPDPDGEQAVEYRPDFAALGVGQYQIQAEYRQTENRASYPARYIIYHRGGSTLIEQDQRDGSDMEEFSLGSYVLCQDSYVRVEDSGGESITFNRMRFTLQ
jgi:hypothetical protein